MVRRQTAAQGRCLLPQAVATAQTTTTARRTTSGAPGISTESPSVSQVHPPARSPTRVLCIIRSLTGLLGSRVPAPASPCVLLDADSELQQRVSESFMRDERNRFRALKLMTCAPPLCANRCPHAGCRVLQAPYIPSS